MILKGYTDGGCSNNGGYNKDLPTIGKFGYVLLDTEDEIVHEYAARDTEVQPTNNRMELKAFIFIMNRLSYIDLITGFEKCTIYSDSQYCIGGFENYEKWFKKKNFPNKDLWGVAVNIYEKIKDRIEIVWIKGHQENNNWNDYIDLKLQDK